VYTVFRSASSSQEQAEVQRLRQTITARDLAVIAAESAAEDQRRAAALREARLAAVQAALQQREAEFQALRASARWHRLPHIVWLSTVAAHPACFEAGSALSWAELQRLKQHEIRLVCHFVAHSHRALFLTAFWPHVICRAKDTEALQLEVQLAAQVTQLSDLEQAGRESAAAMAAAKLQEQKLMNNISQLTDQLASAADSAAQQVAEAVAEALEGTSQQISDAQVSECHHRSTLSYTRCCVLLWWRLLQHSELGSCWHPAYEGGELHVSRLLVRQDRAAAAEDAAQQQLANAERLEEDLQVSR
jgi:hypothetical protein